ncbi:phosphoglycerate kinase [Patescibacteria group bacterium]|nr:MAG: phosphoglycerate kinase [Patescibacteria group bacterium]
MASKKSFKTLRDILHLDGVKVLLRLDLNVPIQKGKVVDDFRIRKSLPTIEYLQKAGAKILIIGHLENKEDRSLKVVAEHMQKYVPVQFVENYRNVLSVLDTLPPSGCLLLENLRLSEGEESNDQKFARELASLADIYVNDAFSVSHREHASIVSVPKYIPGYAGLLFEEEVKNLSEAFVPEHPFLFILGGAKLDSKMPLVEKFLTRADFVFVGGALANNFFKAQGHEIGVSLFSKQEFNLVEVMKNTKLYLPEDVVVKTAGGKENKKPDQVKPDENILDAGEKAVSTLAVLGRKSKLVVWNGPLGDYENNFEKGTEDFARALSDCGAKTIVGGGDTLAVIHKLGIEDKFSFVSTAGGAMLDFLVQETLPGIEALKKSI